MGADIALCGFSVLFTQALRAIHFSRLPADLIVLTILVLFVVLLFMVPGRRTGEKGSRLLDLGGPCVVGARRTSILCVHPLLGLRTAHGLQVGVSEKCTS